MCGWKVRSWDHDWLRLRCIHSQPKQSWNFTKLHQLLADPHIVLCIVQSSMNWCRLLQQFSIIVLPWRIHTIFFRKMYQFKYLTWTWRKKTTFELKLYLKTLLLFPSKVQSLILIPEYKNEDAKSSLFTENELNFVPEHVNKKILKVISISDIHHNIIGWYKKEYWISQIPRIWGVASAEWKEPVAGRSSSKFQTPELVLQMLGLSWQAFLSSKQGMAQWRNQ